MLKDAGENNPVTVFFLDLDRFKAINDTHGHDIGDDVLLEISQRLTGWNKYNALLARLGGDEFVFAFKGRDYFERAEEMARELADCCNETIHIDNLRFNLSASIGITVYPWDASDRSGLMKNADIAMYHAKSIGYRSYTFFNRDLDMMTRRKNDIERCLDKSHYDDEFYLVFQPQFTIPDRQLVGMEALLRWNCPDLGAVMPGEFIPAAEEMGIITKLGRWVAAKAIEQISDWNKRLDSNLKVCINISPRQLEETDFVDKLISIMDRAGVPHNWIDVEITESIAMKGEEAIGTIFSALDEKGITTSIDDFGTGYSSLSYIKKFSFDRLKIAKPLIDNMAAGFEDKQIITAIIMMAKAIGLRTIAEGVETQEQLEALIELECDEVQGYIFSKPLTAAEFEEQILKSPGISP
jgi:diguanylate cyclase (GGDEF)-like protein